MSPVEKAKLHYARSGRKQTFVHDLEAHLLYGWVLSSPTFFAMARPVDGAYPLATLSEPENTFRESQTNCLWVHCIAGNYLGLLDSMPAALAIFRYVGWEREDRKMIRPWQETIDRLKRYLSR